MKKHVLGTNHFAISVLIFFNLLNISNAFSQCTSSATVSGSNTVCLGINSGIIKLTSGVSSVVRWEFGNSIIGPWYSIANTTDSLIYSNLSSTSYFRANVIVGICNPGPSQIAVITVNPTTVGGIITGGTTICSGVNSGILTLSGYTGNIIRWEYSINGTSWTNIANNSNYFSFSNLTVTTIYRALVQSGNCSSSYSSPATVTVNPLPNVNYNFTGTCEKNKTVFTNTSSIASGSISSYNWDFADGGSSVAASPTYTFNYFGTYPVRLTATSNNNCVSSTAKIITINPIPIVDFSQVDVCYKTFMNFYNNSFVPTGTTTVKWYFGDTKATSTDQNPAYKYSKSGNFSTKLVVTSNNFCKDSLTKSVIVFPRADVNFSAKSICFGSDAVFANNSTISGSSLTYQWQFGDGKTSTIFNPTHTYPSNGLYDVTLISTTTDNCKDTIKKRIVVNPLPVSRYSVQNTCSGKISQFYDSSLISTGSIKWFWDFGDGGTSSLQNPSHQFVSVGTYNVILKVTSDSGCYSSISKPTTSYSLPISSFSTSNVCDKDTAYFTNYSLAAAGTLSYMWYFNDGATSTNKSPNHLFGAAGKYNVKLISKTSQGCSDSLSKLIEIYPKPVSIFSVNSICLGSNTVFSNKSTISSGLITTHSWDFGDTSNSLMPNANKLYHYPGTFPVKLIVTSDKGCSHSITKVARVFEMPVADFSYDNICNSVPVQFTNKSTLNSGTLSYLWNFDDGSDTITKSPSHTFSKNGKYMIKMQAISNNNCIDEIKKEIELFEKPEVNAGSDVSISKGYPAKLNAVGASSYEWIPTTDLSDPNIFNPEALPNQNTTYIVKGTDDHGCVDYDTIQIFVENNYKLEPNTVITPDNNGKNDTWSIKNIESYPNSSIYVFDRLGNEVFSSTEYKNDWNCTNKNKEALPDGTYYYVIKVDQSTKVYKGALTILRKY